MIGFSLFLKKLIGLLSEKGLTNSTINMYINQLQKLNGDKNISDINFLLNFDEIINKLSKYKDTTKKNYLAMINSVLGLFKNKKKIRDKYYELMMSLDKEQRERSKNNEKSETQTNNWISWDEVIKIKNQLNDKITSIKNKNTITETQYDDILDYLLISLYTDIPPRRNEYKDMVVVDKWNDKLPNDINYYSKNDNKFIFNIYKTSKKYGQQVMELQKDNPLIKIIDIYLKHHPLRSKSVYSFLASKNGSPFIINTITKRLNNIFGKKKIGASMLRHIYLTNKYGDDINEMKKDAEAMGHSTTEQKEYIKK